MALHLILSFDPADTGSMIRALIFAAFVISVATYAEPTLQTPFDAIRRNLMGALGDPVLRGVLGVVGAILLLSALAQWRRTSRGTLTFSLQEKGFHPNDRIEGAVTLTAKHPIICRKVTVSLRCVIHGNSSRSGTRDLVLYQDTHVVLGETNISEGATKRMTFAVVVPEKVAGVYDQLTESFAATGTLGRVAHSILSATAKIQAARAQWELVAEVDAEGRNLYAHRKLVVKKVL